jgi:hypothetical protein
VASPTSRVACTVWSAVFSCSVTGADLGFAWEADDGGGFVDLTNDATYSGVYSDTLTISGVTTGLNGRLYRCFVTNSCGAVTTGVATLYVSAAPVAACTPTTVYTGDYGTGIERVQFGAIDFANTGNDNDGLSDLVCDATTLLVAGSTNTLTVMLNGGNPEYCQAYIDFDGDGTFTVEERVMDSGLNVTHSAQVVIPKFPQATDRLVRMRVISEFGGIAGPCDDVDYGEFEDYGVYIPTPPCAAPVITMQPSDTIACTDGSATFTCAADGPSMAYQWQADTGAGYVNVMNGGYFIGSTSATMYVVFVPSAMNRYRFRCLVTNACGEAATSPAELGVGAPASACSPITINTGNFGTGIVRVQFNGIDHIHNDSSNDGTRDFTCIARTVVQANTTYAFTITLSGGNPEYCRIYIDYDNDGAFSAGEMVYNNNTTRQTAHSGNVTIPVSGFVPDQLLRMRVISDYSSIVSGCNNVSYGEVEDYGIYIRSPTQQRVTGVTTPTSTNIVIHSSGPIGAFTGQYSTNLLDPDAWQALAAGETVWSNGTNITTFSLPEGVPAAVIRHE